MRNFNKSMIAIGISLLLIGCQQPMLDNGETKLKHPSEYTVSEYDLSDFNFAKQVQYFEVIEYVSHPSYQSRQVKKFAKKVDRRFPVAIHKYYPKGKNSLSETQKRSLQMLKHEMFIGVDHLGRDCSSSMMASFCTRIVQYIDESGKSHIVSTKKELKAVLGRIDTPAEVQLWLTLSGSRPAYSCKKADDAYRVRWNYIQYTDMAGLCYHRTFLEC